MPFYTIFAPIVGKELSELLAAGLSYSFPACVNKDGRLFDAMFLYRQDADEPSAWLMLDSCTGRLALLCERAVMDFAAEGLSAPDSAVEARQKGFSPKKEAQLKARLSELYDEIRGFVFFEKLDRAQASSVAAYKELFLKLIAPGHYPFYYALSPAFFHWLRMPLPVHRAKLSAEEKPVFEDSTQLLILENLQQLVLRFEQKIQVDAHKQELFDEIHAELQEYKNGMLDQLTLALERDVIKLIDDVQKSLSVFGERPATPESYERLYAMFSGVATDLEDLLYRHGVEPYTVNGSRVNVARQKILSTTPTCDPAQDRTIERRISRGWEKDGKIIRPERVSVYLYEEADNA